MTLPLRAPARTNGNAFVYILISVILLGGLSFAISRSNDSNPSSEISAGATTAAVTSILAYEAQAQMAVDQMVQNGTTIDNIDFTRPAAATFNTAPTINKLFHPDGGGLQFKSLPASAVQAGITSPASTYAIGKMQNIEWTPTGTSDVIFTAYGIPLAVCQALNKKIHGATTTVVWNNDISTFVTSLLNTGYVPATFSVVGCPLCDKKAAACGKGTGAAYLYYSILISR